MPHDKQQPTERTQQSTQTSPAAQTARRSDQVDLEAARRAAALGPNPLGPYAVRKRPAYSIMD